MPSKTSKQQRFFKAVQRAQHDTNYGDERLRKVAHSVSPEDVHAFVSKIAESKRKKALIKILKDIREPMYLEEENENGIEPVASTFHVKKDWAEYLKPYIGQPLSPKELEAVDNFKDQGGKEATSITRTDIWYKVVDKFGINKITVIKKMKDSGQLSFIAFQKPEKKAEPEEEKPDGNDMMGGLGSNTSLEEQDIPPIDPTSAAEPEEPDPEKQEKEKEEKEKDDIIVIKSILFKDDIKGAAILIEFLKKLDL